MNSDENSKSYVTEVRFHTLDTLVWDFVQRRPNDAKNFVNFADLYLYFCKCPIFASKKSHSTSGVPSGRRRMKEGKPVQYVESKGLGCPSSKWHWTWETARWDHKEKELWQPEARWQSENPSTWSCGAWCGSGSGGCWSGSGWSGSGWSGRGWSGSWTDSGIF